jgi:phospholipid-translocating ATPase
MEIETVAFTSLIFLEYFLTLSQLHSLHIVMIISNLGSALTYLLTIYLMPQLLVVSKLSGKFFLTLLIIVIASWLPLYLLQLVIQKFDPSDYEKIMKQVKRQKIRTNIFD